MQPHCFVNTSPRITYSTAIKKIFLKNLKNHSQSQLNLSSVQSQDQPRVLQCQL